MARDKRNRRGPQITIGPYDPNQKPERSWRWRWWVVGGLGLIVLLGGGLWGLRRRDPPSPVVEVPVPAAVVTDTNVTTATPEEPVVPDLPFAPTSGLATGEEAESTACHGRVRILANAPDYARDFLSNTAKRVRLDTNHWITAQTLPHIVTNAVCGDMDVWLEADGFKADALSRRAVIQEGRTSDVAFLLTPLPSTLLLACDAKDAVAQIGNVKFSSTNVFSVASLQPVRVTVTAAGSPAQALDLGPYEPLTTNRHVVAFKRAAGAVRIEATVPTNAAAFFQGLEKRIRISSNDWKTVTSLPYVADGLPCAELPVDLVVTGFQTAGTAPRSVRVIDAQTNVVLFQMEPLPAQLTVACNVTGALIQIADQSATISNLFSIPSLQDLTVTISATGYVAQVLRLAAMNPGRAYRKEVKLELDTDQIAQSSVPADVNIDADYYWDWATNKHSAQAYRNFMYYFPEDPRQSVAVQRWEQLEYSNILVKSFGINLGATAYIKAMEQYWLFKKRHPNSIFPPPEDQSPISPDAIRQASFADMKALENDALGRRCIDILRAEAREGEGVRQQASMMGLIEIGDNYIAQFIDSLSLTSSSSRGWDQLEESSKHFCHPAAVAQLLKIASREKNAHDDHQQAYARRALNYVPSRESYEYLANLSEKDDWPFMGIWRFGETSSIDVVKTAMVSPNPRIRSGSAEEAVVYLDNVSSNFIWTCFTNHACLWAPRTATMSPDVYACYKFGRLVCMKGDERILRTDPAGWLDRIDSPSYFGPLYVQTLGQSLENGETISEKYRSSLFQADGNPERAEVVFKKDLDLVRRSSLYVWGTADGAWYGPHFVDRVIVAIKESKSEGERRALTSLLAFIDDRRSIAYLISLARAQKQPEQLAENPDHAMESERGQILRFLCGSSDPDADKYLNSLISNAVDRTTLARQLMSADPNKQWVQSLYQLADTNMEFRTSFLRQCLYGMGTSYNRIPHARGIAWTKDFLSEIRAGGYRDGVLRDLWNDESNSWLKKIIEYWARCGDPALVEDIRVAYCHFIETNQKAGHGIRLCAVKALTSIAANSSPKILEPFLGNENLAFRSVAIEAYSDAVFSLFLGPAGGGTPESQSIPKPLISALDEDRNVSVYAARAILRLLPGVPTSLGLSTNADDDNDGLSDDAESNIHKTNPFEKDTDRGGVDDGHEVVEDKTDPLNPKDDLQLFTMNIEFDYDKADVKPEYYDDLDVIVKTLKRQPGATARVEGHSDRRKSLNREYVQRLSELRARAVVDYMVETGGIDRARLTYQGYGFDRPLAPNDTEANMRKNRRTEVYVRPEP